MINEFLNNIQQRFIDAFSGLAEFFYLAEWYVIGALVLLTALVIGYFLPFKWTRAALGFIVICFGAFLAGMQVMANHFKAERQRDRERIKEMEAAERPKRNGGGFFPFS